VVVGRLHDAPAVRFDLRIDEFASVRLHSDNSTDHPVGFHETAVNDIGRKNYRLFSLNRSLIFARRASRNASRM
jgi:hypothetical protein